MSRYYRTYWIDPSLDADGMLVASALALAVAWGAVWCAGGMHAHLTTLAWPSSAGGGVVAQAVPLPHACASQAGVGRCLPSVDVFRAQGSGFSIVIVAPPVEYLLLKGTGQYVVSP